MKSLQSTVYSLQKKHQAEIILGLILILALFFRVYKLDIFYISEHDQDLSAWIVKDIWVNHHLRLIGQLTSIEGVFIGPLFYYLLTPFYVLSGMNPLSATMMGVLFGLVTVWSIYFVFSRFFGKSVGLFGAAIYAASLGPVFFDRWIVPTIPTMLWCVWLLYTAFSLAEGKTRSLFIAAILIGTIWHIHIALLPLVPLLIIAFFLHKQKLTPKNLGISVAILLGLTLPFWVFELKHNFLQTRSLLSTSGNASEILTGSKRFFKIIDSFSKILNSSLVQEWNIPSFIVPIISGGLLFFTTWKKIISVKQLTIIAAWLILVFGVQMFTHNPISEYYVINITILPILFLALFLNYLYNKKNLRKIAIGLVVIYMILNTFFLLSLPEPLHLYVHKKALVDFIAQDYQKNNYKCISTSYIAKYGTGVGFRYLLWWEGMHEIQANSKTPLYSIVIPYDSIDKNQLDAQFGYFGVILPPEGNYDSTVCNDPVLEPIAPLGFTN